MVSLQISTPLAGNAVAAAVNPALATRLAIRGLDPAPFRPFFGLSDAELAGRGIRRVIALENPGINYPCRVSLAYPQAGEELLLLNYRHLDRPGSPYRAEGPIFVRRGVSAFAGEESWPPIIMQRAMAVRAYDHEAMMVEADMAEKDDLVAMARGWLARPDIAHVDIHSLRRGCFFCRITRA